MFLKLVDKASSLPYTSPGLPEGPARGQEYVPNSQTAGQAPLDDQQARVQGCWAEQKPCSYVSFWPKGFVRQQRRQIQCGGRELTFSLGYSGTALDPRKITQTSQFQTCSHCLAPS